MTPEARQTFLPQDEQVVKQSEEVKELTYDKYSDSENFEIQIWSGPSAEQCRED